MYVFIDLVHPAGRVEGRKEEREGGREEGREEGRRRERKDRCNVRGSDYLQTMHTLICTH